MASEDDNYGSLSVKGTPVAELKVNDIKKELDKRGLSKAGSKTQMLERLKAQLLLEKLQQDAAQSSGDELEGKVPNMALQQESAGQSEFVRQYLEQQQRNLERQMEVKKQVEEERKRKSADESSADETPTHQEPKIDPDVTSPKKFKDDDSNAPAAPASDESKMPRPARKSSRNASKGENGQDSGVVKEKSRSPSPEKESLRERTRSGSSSSSRSATPEATSRRGRSTRGARGGRRGGRRGRGRPQVSRKESRSSSHSSTEEEVMPKKRSRRSTNSRSSRSRSRSPSLKTSPELTPATRRSSRRISATKTPPDLDLSTGEPELAQKTKESPAITSIIEKVKEDDAKMVEVAEDAKSADVKEMRRSVEVLEPAESTIKAIEVAEIKNVEAEKGAVSETKEDEDQSAAPAETDEVLSRKIESSGSELRNESESEPKENTDKGHTKLNVEKSGEIIDAQDSTVGADNSNKTNANIEKPLQSISEQPSEKTKDDKSTKKQDRRSSGSSSSSSSTSSPPRKRETNRGRSASSGSSTDITPNASENLPKTTAPLDVATKEVTKTAQADQNERIQPVQVRDQQMESKPEPQTTSISSNSEQGNEVDDSHKLQKSWGGKSESPQGVRSENQEVSETKCAKQGEGDADNKESKEKTAEKRDQVGKIEDETLAKKDKAAKKRKWGSKSSKTTPATTKKPTSIEISSDSLKNLIGEVKLSETVFDMETEVVNTLDYDEQEEDRRDVKVKRTVVKKNSSPGPDEVEMADDVEEEEDARKVEASGDAPGQSGKEQEPEKNIEDDNQTGDEAEEVQEAEPKKKAAKLTSPDETEPKEIAKKKTLKEAKKIKKKKVTAVEATEGKENKVVSNDKAAKEPGKKVATTRPSKPILPIVDEPEKVAGRGDMSPARHPPDRVLRIAGLVRPFTIRQLKELFKRTGELDEEHFWINDIKSHCFAAFKTEDDAVKTRAALHGTRWPQSNPKILHIDFSTIEDLQHRKSGGEGPPPALMRKNQEQSHQREPKQEVKKDPVQKDKEERDARRRPPASDQREQRKEGEKIGRDRERPPPQIREWDKDKMKQLSRSRSKDRDRPSRRSRSRERDQRKRREGSREKREDEKKKERRQKEPKAEDEPPAKLLDDLFRKTKATPCIYWLPLTEEQAKQKAIEREEREKEKQKRRAAAEEKEKEELKKREAARLERQKQREKERERSREKERSGGRDRSRDRNSRERGRGGRTERSRTSRSRSGSASRSRRRR